MNFRRPKRKNCDVNVVPLINVIFLLLIFFMVAGRVDKVDMFEIELPMSENGFPESRKPPTIYLGADGDIAVNDDLVAREDFETIINTLLLDNPDIEVVVKSDVAVLANTLIWAMSTIEKAGGTNIALLTQSAG